MNTEQDEKVIQMNPEIKEARVKEATVVDEGTKEAPDADGALKQDPNQMHYDPNEFGYQKGERVPFTGNLVLSLMGILNQVAINETSVVYEPKENFQATYETGKETVTDLGLQAIRLMEFITEEHLMNIDQGFATHMDELQKQNGAPAPKKPAFEVENVEKEG